MKNVFIRLNGRGNAWPVFLGNNHPFYSLNEPDDLGNVSYSIIGSNNAKFNIQQIEWELLVDAGNNTVSYLIRHENRIPEAIILTHPHLDHTVGVDWIAESYVFRHEFKKKYPLYATLPCWEFVRQSFPQLMMIIEFHELVPGIQCKINEVSDTYVTAFPVFHGESAFGASLLLFEYRNPGDHAVRAVFTGDMLSPLLRDKDFREIAHSKLIHYSGYDDNKYYNEKVLNDQELESWANQIITREGLKSKVYVPRTGDIFKLA